MGAWGGLCVFDYVRYTQAVVPAFHSGEQHPFIQQTLTLAQHERPQHLSSAFRGLAQLITHCDPLMTTCALDRSFAVCDGVLNDYIQREQPCADWWGYEEIADLFERMITRYTLSHYTILGLAFTAVWQLFPPELELDAVTRTLIDLLDNRCRYWAAGTGGYGEGIHGWLDPAETELLALGLVAFPAFNPTTAGSESARLESLFEYCYDSEEQYAQHIARIAQFMRILQQARILGRGVLWGRDLRLFYKHAGLFAAGEIASIEW